MAQDLERFHFLVFLLYPKYQSYGLTSGRIEYAHIRAKETKILTVFLS